MMRFKLLIAGAAALVVGWVGVWAAGTAAAAPTRYEAEAAPAVCTGTIDNDWSGYSGSGFCNGTNEVGAYAQFTVNAAAAGTATLGVRFANGTTSSRPADVAVNGSTVDSVSFEPTGEWSAWATKTLTVMVAPGNNIIRFDPTGEAGLPNLDFLDVEVAPVAQPRHEAETAPAVCDGTIDANHSGFSGSGFCNTANESGAGVTFTVSGSGSAASVAVRYANGASANRPADIVVNGSTQVSNVAFNPTGAWNTWATVTVTVNLRSGSNSLRLQATGADGLSNIDYIDVTGGGDPSPSPTPTSTPTPTPTPTPTTTPPPTEDTLYVAPNGRDSGSGTISDPTTLTSALTRIEPGGTIYMRGGTYNFSQTITIQPDNSGTSGARKKLFAYQGETPVLNFSAQSEDPANRGLAVGGSFWHIFGIVVERAGDNGILLAGNNNIIERVVTRFNRDSGLQLSRLIAGAPRDQWPSYNLVVSSVSHDNVDSDGEDADGFAPKLTVGPGNVFRYTVSHNNIDDGYDLYTKTDTGPIGAVTIEYSLAYENGTLSDGSQAGAGDRNGYKLGGEDIAVNHVIRGNIAYDNGKHGFTYNRNLGTMTMSDNVGVGNEERNFNFDGGSSVFRNNTSCDSGSNDRIIGDADGSNQFWSGSNGSRCSQYSGALDWYFAADGRLVVTFGATQITP